MKKTFFVGFFLLLTSLTSSAATQKLKVPRLKAVGGGIHHLVLAQTTPEFVEKRSGITILRKYYIARWGFGRFEYGMAQYQCHGPQCELLGETVALKYFKNCSGFKKDAQPVCKNLESARIDVSDPHDDADPAQDKRKWFTCEDYGTSCSERDELNESPSREGSEVQDLHAGI